MAVMADVELILNTDCNPGRQMLNFSGIQDMH